MCVLQVQITLREIAALAHTLQIAHIHRALQQRNQVDSAKVQREKREKEREREREEETLKGGLQC